MKQDRTKVNAQLKENAGKVQEIRSEISRYEKLLDQYKKRYYDLREEQNRLNAEIEEAQPAEANVAALVMRKRFKNFFTNFLTFFAKF